MLSRDSHNSGRGIGHSRWLVQRLLPTRRWSMEVSGAHVPRFPYGTAQRRLGGGVDHHAVGGVCRPARAGNPDSVGEANGDAVVSRKASIEAFLEFWRITGLRPVSGLPIRKANRQTPPTQGLLEFDVSAAWRPLSRPLLRRWPVQQGPDRLAEQPDLFFLADAVTVEQIVQ